MGTTKLERVTDIPVAWRNALAQLQTCIPSAVMAGGCLRDREHGRKVKDLDIFVPVSTDSHADLEAVKVMLEGLGWKSVTIDDAKTYPEGCDTRVIGVVEADVFGCPPVQVVVGNWDTDRIFDHFDFGICQISFDGRELKRSVAYRLDSLNRVFKLATNRSDEAFVSSINRWARLKEKYRDWTFQLGTRSSSYSVETHVWSVDNTIPAMLSRNEAILPRRGHQIVNPLP
jgi:hypothetical protein